MRCLRRNPFVIVMSTPVTLGQDFLRRETDRVSYDIKNPFHTDNQKDIQKISLV